MAESNASASGYKRKRSVISLEKKTELIGELEKGFSQRCESEIFNVPKSTVADIWKNSEKNYEACVKCCESICGQAEVYHSVITVSSPGCCTFDVAHSAEGKGGSSSDCHNSIQFAYIQRHCALYYIQFGVHYSMLL